MFYSDYPIEKQENDCLNRTIFSKQLAEAILSYTKTDNFVISLCGRWGSGKTSILNMVIEEIESLSKKVKEEERIIIVKFNPWNYSDCSQLISQFFSTLQTELRIFGNNEALCNVGSALEKYSSILDYSSYIPVVGQYLGPLKDLVSGLGSHMKEFGENGSSVESQKKRVVEALSNQKQKFLVVIDDIDRLNNKQIRAIFQLVNSLAGFPNMIYLLSFDRNVVSRALHEEQGCDGEEYLEKIIQVPFEVPEANKELVNNFLFERCYPVFFDNEEEESCFEKEYWSNIFSECISPFIKNLRDINRVMNAFEFKLNLMKDEVNKVDLLALTTLQICAPEIFYWIRVNKVILTGSIESTGGITGVEQKKNEKCYLDIFEKIYSKNPQNMLRIIGALFPQFAWHTGGYVQNNDTNDELRLKDKIASNERFDRYFNLSLEEISISKVEIKKSVFEYSKEEWSLLATELLKNNKLVDYLQEVRTYIPELSTQRKEILMDLCIEINAMEMAQMRANAFTIVPASMASNVLTETLRQNEKNANKHWILNTISKTNLKTLPSCCSIVEKLERAYGRVNQYLNSSEQYVLENALDEINIALTQRIRELLSLETLVECREVETVMYTWSLLEKESYDIFIKKVANDSRTLPIYLFLYAGTWYGGKNHGWHFEKERYTEHISKAEAYEKIKSLKGTNTFKQLPLQYKEIAIAFFLWCSDEIKDKHDINEIAVANLIEKWAKEVVS